jgi:molecular chaperone DnaK (HSP70)
VAYGAAVQGGILGDDSTAKSKDILLIDVTPLTLGVEIKGGVMSKMIPRGTKIPTSKTEAYTTAEDHQSSIGVKVFEGERSRVKDNRLLGEFTLGGIPRAKRNVPQIDVTFMIDENSILSVTAKERKTGSSESITITNDKSRLSKEDIDKMIRNAEKFRESDKQAYERQNAMNSLD